MRFGLIGLGAIGRVRKAAIERTPRSKLTAVYDCDLDLAKRLAGDTPVFNSVEELVTSDTCDAVILSTPPNFHAHQATAALEAGKHVIVEKPMASSLAECRDLVERSRRTRRILAVGFNHRYFAAIKAMRTAIQSGEIGTLSYLRAYAGHTGMSEFTAPWMHDKDIMGGGTLMDNGIHLLDLTRHLMGDIASVYGFATNDIWDLDRSEDNGFALMRSSDGVVASLHSSWSEWRGYRFFIEAYGDRGMARAYYAPMTSTVITVDRRGGTRKIRRNFFFTAMVREKLKGWQSTVIQTFVEQHSDFIDLTLGNTDGICAQAVDGLRATEIANAVYQSSRTGQRVPLAKEI